jgi:hypothetical protein
MAKADFTLSDGTAVSLDGSPDEVARLLELLTARAGVRARPVDGRAAASRVRKRAAAATGSRRSGPTDFVLELRQEGYFNTKRSLKDILQRLEEKGHIYARTSLSPVLVRLVRRRELRRVKDDRTWAYVS